MSQTTVYLQLDSAEGKFFQYSKDPQEGYEKHVTEKTEKSEGGKVSYRKYYDEGIIGRYVGIDKRESPIGDQLQIVFETQTIRYVASVAMYYSQTQWTKHASAFMSYLKGMKAGRVYFCKPFTYQKKDAKNKTYGFEIIRCKVNPDGTVIYEADSADKNKTKKVDRYSQAYTTREGEVVDGEIPAIVWKKKQGKDVANTDDADEFFYKLFTENRTEGLAVSSHARQTAEFSDDDSENEVPASGPATNLPAAQKTVVNTVESTSDDDDDSDELPF